RSVKARGDSRWPGASRRPEGHYDTWKFCWFKNGGCRVYPRPVPAFWGCRRMFGGGGFFALGGVFGLVSGGQIYLKADATTATWFERECCGQFEYSTKHGKRALTSYWRLPDRLYDDADELRSGLGMHSR